MVKHARYLLNLRGRGKSEGGKQKNRGQEKGKFKVGKDKEVG